MNKYIISVSILMGALCLACEVEVKSETRCGDGRVDLTKGEQCDGDDLAGETCPGLGYHGGDLACTAGCTYDIAPCLAAGRCGDDTIQVNWSEDCDGPELDDQSCLTLGYHGGALTCGSNCRFDLSNCEEAGRCGDDLIQTDFTEDCDGTALGDATCASLGFYGGNLACGEDCVFDTAGCEQGIFCGDGVIQDAWGETCDGANLGGQTCLSLGFHDGELACDGACTLDLSACEEAGRCGDDIIQDAWGEICDGANLDGQSCQSLGFATGTLFCQADCTLDTGACFNWSGISTGDRHTCAVGPDATVWCWGANDYGQLGDGSTAASMEPVQVTGLPGVRQISVGALHTCAVLTDDSVWCWGYNGEYQLGDLTGTNQATPVQVFGPLAAASVSAGLSHTCALLHDGTVRCWGDNFGGQLGDGSTTLRAMPTAVLQITDAVEVSVGDFSTCALLADGTVRCWGVDDYGQLGDGAVGGFSSTPVAVTGLGDARSVSVGRNHACSVRAGGQIACWGRNNLGECGDGTTADSRPLFVTVYNLTSASAVSCGTAFTCARLADGTARCWGANDDGQLGDGSATGRLFPVTVQGLSDVAAISAGDTHTCAATASAALSCWGLNSDGQLGDGTTTDSWIPVPVQ